MIVMTVFLLLINQMEFCLVQNENKNCQFDHISFELKGIRIHFQLEFDICKFQDQK